MFSFSVRITENVNKRVRRVKDNEVKTKNRETDVDSAQAGTFRANDMVQKMLKRENRSYNRIFCTGT